MNDLFCPKYGCWTEIEAKIESIPNEIEKGNAFEEFVWFYLDYHRELYQISEVYARIRCSIPREIIKRLKLENVDYGVDGVTKLRSGELAAYQVKFRSGRVSPTATELATFWAEAEYAEYRYIIANSFSLPRVAGKKKNHLAILGDKFEALPPEFFEALHRYASQIAQAPRVLHKARDYQRKMLDDIASGFQRSDRGKLIAACGSGKTLVALWATEELKADRVLFMAPSLALIRQTLGEWADQARVPFSYICVCSDPTVSEDIDADDAMLLPSEVDVPVTTEPEDVTSFLGGATAGKRVVFCTYQSLDVLAQAVSKANKLQFDLSIFDEAHRTAGLRNSQLFSLALDNAKVGSKLRLFMTATERMVRSRIKEVAEQAQQIVFSMDDESVYGPVFHRLSFGEAITKKVIADYRVVLAGISGAELDALIKKNRYLAPDITETAGKPISAQTLFKELLLTKAIAELDIRKAISFHSSVREAQRFIASFQSLALVVLDSQLSGAKTYFGHVNGNQSASERALAISAFEESETGVLSNVRCLSEGVDIPLIDAIFFADPRNSPIDIVQAVGRALRQRYGSSGKIAYVIVPLLIPSKADQIETINADAFEGLHNVIQAMRDQDETLAEWIDSINLAAVSGKHARPTKGTGKLTLILPQEIGIEQFYEHIILRIAEINRDPSGTVGLGSQLGKKERISTYTRVFKTLGDYNPGPYQQLVDATISKFRKTSSILARSRLAINNNNVSHSQRLGVIVEVGKGQFALSPIGRRYAKKVLCFDDLFKNQMLLYSENVNGNRLFPYRAAFEVLLTVQKLNYIEFLYGLYSIQVQASQKQSVQAVCDRITSIRTRFPRVELTSEANRDAVREELNKMHPIGFQANDVWTDRTTSGNQFRYFFRHMELFHNLFVTDWSTKVIAVKDTAAVKRTLEASNPARLPANGGYGQWLWIRRKSK